MSKYIRTIGDCLSNGYSIDIYENDDGTASIRAFKNEVYIPKKGAKFMNLDHLERWVEGRVGESEEFTRVRNLINFFLDDGYDHCFL